MLDIDTLDDLFQENEYILNKELIAHFSRISINDKPLQGEININSTLIDLAKFYQSLENFESEYEQRKKIAPNWETALEAWIKSLESIELGLNDRDEYLKPFTFFAYQDITQGKNKFLHEYARSLLTGHDENKYVQFWELKNLALGVAIAYKLPKLKEELKLIRDFGQNVLSDLQPMKQKLNWTGTAGEFTAIIDLLIEKGFIEDVPQKNNKAKLCLELFSIKNQKSGHPIAERTLTECFGKDKYNFLPNDLKMPLSVTYGKVQLPTQKQNGNRTENMD